MHDWRKQQIDQYITQLSDYYRDCSGNYFEGIYYLTKLNKEELSYFHSKLNLPGLVGVERQLILHSLLKDPEKRNFLEFVFFTGLFNLEVNVEDEQGFTPFMIIADQYIGGNSRGYHQVERLMEWGYVIKPKDGAFVKQLYQKVDSQRDFETWTYLRFAVILNDFKMYQVAMSKSRELFTILSLKMGKPIGFNYPNLLGVVNNALQHYRESGDLLLEAIDVFGQAEKIQKLDRKKGTFAHKKAEYLENKPFQDKEFEEVAKIVFPELR